MKTNILDEELLVRKAVSLLVKKLGTVESARFLSIASQKRKYDSVQRHQLWQKKLNKDEFFNKVFKI